MKDADIFCIQCLQMPSLKYFSRSRRVRVISTLLTTRLRRTTMRIFRDRPVTIGLYFFTLCVASILSLQTIFSDNISLYGDFTQPLSSYAGDANRVYIVQRTLYNGTSVSIWVRDCVGNGSTYEVNWMIRDTECFNEDADLPYRFIMNDKFKLKGESQFWYYTSAFPVTQTCGEKARPLRDETNENWIAVPPIPLSAMGSSKRRMEAFATKNKVTEVRRDGNYILIVYMSSNSKILSQVNIEIEFQSERGFPSKYPDNVLLFHNAMCCIYVLETIIWFVLVACNWKSLLRIHHLMSSVLLISVSASIFDAILHDMQNRWIDVKNADVALDIMIVFQTSLCLFFMILFSLGDGITKPKLSRCSCAFTSLTTLIFFLCSSCLTVYIRYHDSRSTNNKLLVAIAILVVLFGVVLVIWIGNNLITTIRQLHRQKQFTKMILYIFVTIGLVLYALTNIAAIGLYFQQKNTCAHVTEVLIGEGAFVPVILSAFLLFVIVLIRPTSSNLGFLRYETIYDKSDDSDDDEDENIFTRHKLETVV